MKFDIEKPKTYKGNSYVLKSSVLKNKIEETGLDCNVHLVYWTPKSGGSILTAEYWLPNKRIEYDRFYIRSGVVNSEDRKHAAELLENKIIPILIDRIKFIKNESQNSTKVKHGLFLESNYIDGELFLDGKRLKT